MTNFLNYTPEVLNSYRISVANWLQKAAQALDTFSDATTGSYFSRFQATER
jgi:hypothetical protein